MIECLELLELTLSQTHSLQRSVHANHRSIRPSHLCANSIWCDYIISGRQYRHLLAGSIRKAWNTPYFDSTSWNGALYHLKLFGSSQYTSPRLKMAPRVSSSRSLTADQQHRALDSLDTGKGGRAGTLPSPLISPLPSPTTSCCERGESTATRSRQKQDGYGSSLTRQVREEERL